MAHAAAQVKPASTPEHRPGGDAAPVAPDCIGNRNFWTNHDWSRAGEEWSDAWGGTDRLWFGSLLPRLHAALPAAHIIEIGPGFGRITEHLRGWCDRLSAVDLTPRCVEHCRRRFAGDARVRVHQNDGRSLGMIESASVDLAVSWESLVHAERGTVSAYLAELARTLRPGGIGLIHHSNLGEHAHQLSGDEPGALTAGRRTCQTAERFVMDCRGAGLRCRTQEIISWNDNGLWTDCLSVIERDPANVSAAPRVIRRLDWRVEQAVARTLGELYRQLPPVER